MLDIEQNHMPGIPREWTPPMADISWVKRKYLDLPYGQESKNQCLDLYLPECGEGPFPVLVHIHGGGFAFGDKRDDHLDAYLKALHKGMAVASVEYRMSGEAKFPAAVLDCRAAIRFLRAHAEEYHLDGDKIIAIGGSAGGNLAAMLGMNVPNGEFPGESGDFQVQPLVAVAIDQFGPVRFETMARQARENGISKVSQDPAKMPESKYLGCPLDQAPEQLLAQSYPGTYASENMAPMLVQHGTMDHLVPCAQSEEFVKDLCARGYGDRVEYLPLEGADHEDKRFFQDENMEAVFAFIHKHM